MTMSPSPRADHPDGMARSAGVGIAVLVWAPADPAALFGRRPPLCVDGRKLHYCRGGREDVIRKMRSFDAVLVLALTFLHAARRTAGPIFPHRHLAMTCGIAPLAADEVYSVDGLAGLGGRPTLAWRPDRWA